MKYLIHLWAPALGGVLALAGIQAQAATKTIMVRAKGTGVVIVGLADDNKDNVVLEVYDQATPPKLIQSMQTGKQSRCWLKRGWDYTAKFTCLSGSFTARMFAVEAGNDKKPMETTKTSFVASSSVTGKEVKIVVPPGSHGLPLEANASWLTIGER
jgi:hypothetical protein